MFLRPEHHGDRREDRQQLSPQNDRFLAGSFGIIPAPKPELSLTVLALKNLTVQCYRTSFCNAHEMK